MTETPESKACRRYAERAAAIDAISHKIGNALDQCPMVYIRGSSVLGTNNHTTHLKIAYSIIYVEPHHDDWGHGHRPATADDVDVFLSTADWNFHDYATIDDQFDMTKIDSLACPNCLEAHRLIQQRKDLRVLFGAAKRAVRAVGKRINRNMEGE